MDALWDMYSIYAAQVVPKIPTVVAFDELIWRLTYVSEDAAERIVVLIPRHPAGIGALCYILAKTTAH